MKQDWLKQIQSAASWEERFRCLVQMGRTLESFPSELKTKENTIESCVSEVFFACQFRPETKTLVLFAETDVKILKGMLAFLILICQEKSPAAVMNIDFEGVLKQNQLDGKLSGTREDAVKEAIARIRAFAKAHS